MALSGVHIAFGSAIGLQNGLLGQLNLPVYPFLCSASQTMTSPGTSTVCAPGSTEQALLSISASVQIYYAVGPKPDLSGVGVRFYAPNYGREDIIVNSGDFFAWTSAVSPNSLLSQDGVEILADTGIPIQVQ